LQTAVNQQENLIVFFLLRGSLVQVQEGEQENQALTKTPQVLFSFPTHKLQKKRLISNFLKYTCKKLPSFYNLCQKSIGIQ